MVKTRFFLSAAAHTLIICFLANCFLLIRRYPGSLYIFVPLFLLACIFSAAAALETPRSRACVHGTILLHAFYISLIPSILYHGILAICTLPDDYMPLIWSGLMCVGVLFVVFWIGILCLYLTSSQLGFRLRLKGLLCGLIPIWNLIVLYSILKITTAESLSEMERELRNRERKVLRLCDTRYPILLVHGVFFRDIKFFNYWGRIPKELELNGARIFYGQQPSAVSIADSAAFLKERIREILEETGAEKVNIIAHSKGGLDCRYAIAKLGIGSCVASLTTVNTPHRGCLFADYLLTKVSPNFKDRVARTYNTALHKLGEKEADFLAAVNDLTDSHCKQLDSEMPTPEGIFCQSIGSVLASAGGSFSPLNLSYHLVDFFSGENDGLVSVDSFAWGEKYTLLRPSCKKGISHSDIIDLTRENIPEFDVREFYVELVNDLKTRGL